MWGSRFISKPLDRLESRPDRQLVFQEESDAPHLHRRRHELPAVIHQAFLFKGHICLFSCLRTQTIGMFDPLAKPHPIPNPQIAQRQLSEYRKGVYLLD